MAFFNTFLSFLVGDKPVGRQVADRLNTIKTERERLATKPPRRPEAKSPVNKRLDRIKQERERLDQRRQDEIDRQQRERDRQQNDPEWRFLNEQEEISTPASSNVTSFWYDGRDYEFFVRFTDGSIYKYVGVPPDVAIKFYQANSKGGAVWDYFRIRGTSLGHQYSYYMVMSPTRGAGKSIAPGHGTRKIGRASCRERV